VFFCEKASPWQRPSKENINGPLRDYVPKGSDLRVHGADRRGRGRRRRARPAPQDTRLGSRPHGSSNRSPAGRSAEPTRAGLAMMGGMADMRRHGPEPAVGLPRVEHKPGLADEMLRELAPLLAEEGIDLSGDDPPDMQRLQAALNRAVERRNLELFSPVGATRQIAVDALHRVVDAVLAGDSATAGRLLEQVQPESPDDTVATVSSCIGIALGRLDDILTAGSAPPVVALPAGHWNGERAATDILALARKGKAFRSLEVRLQRLFRFEGVAPGASVPG
jgi:hypothetical protein